MNRIFRLLSVVVIGLAISPLMVNAAWYDSFRVFRSDQKKVEVVSVPTTTPTLVVKEVEKPIIKEKIVTQVVKIDNPELKLQIEVLRKENEELKGRVEAFLQVDAFNKSLVSQLNQCKAEVSEIKTESTSVRAVFSDACESAKEKYSLLAEQKPKKMTEVEDWYQKAIRDSGTSRTLLSRVDIDYQIKLRSIKSEFDLAAQDVKFYCE